MKNSDFVGRAVLVVLFSYALALGGTFNGLIEPQFRLVSLVLFALFAICWLLIHWWRGWTWHRTPLDGVFVLWMAAFILSILANEDTWRRSAMALWFMGMYIGVWYALYDVVANQGIKRDTFIDGALFSGLIVLIFGYAQVLVVLSSGRGIPRPVSTLGNANALAAYLVVLVPLALGRLVAVRAVFGRIVLGVYSVLAILLLLMTASRGAWAGLAAALVVGGILLLAYHHLLSLPRLRDAWRNLRASFRAAVVLAFAGALIAAAVLGSLLIRSLNEPGRDISNRTYLYHAALQLFIQKPLTGQGLFTFGYYLPLFSSMPPDKPHSHAHNAPLHIAAELGLVGMTAFVITLIVIFFAIRRNWREALRRDRLMLVGAISAVVGFGIHHLLDTPAMMPVVALVGLVALVLALSPVTFSPMTARWRAVGHPFAMVGLWGVLVVSGFWSTGVYNDYLAVLRDAVRDENFRAAAERLQPVIDSDSSLSLYRAQQAFLFGLAANAGDSWAAQAAIAAYEQVVRMEPNYAPYWANLSALYWNSGQLERGFEAMQKAAALAPEAWQLQYDLGLYAEALGGHEETARAAYQQALVADSDADLHPAWGQTALQAEIRSDPAERSDLALMVTMMKNLPLNEASELWVRELSGTRRSSTYIVRELLAIAQNDREGALAWLSEAEMIMETREDAAWIHLGKARLAQFNGDETAAASELKAARESLERGLFDADEPDALSMDYGQFLRSAIPRQFLPQVYYPVENPVLMHLLDGT
jgi:O-antigen ligase/tetratricopeptide (TPR) repeat protein